MTILSLGSAHVDVQLRAPRPPAAAGTLLAGDLLRTSGGKAANVAVQAVRLGAEACLLGCVGDDDLAEQALAGPRREGVDVRGVRRAPGPTGLACIVVTPGGDKSIVLALNANDAWDAEESSVHDAVDGAAEGSVLVADLEVPPPLVAGAVRAARARGFVVVVDPAPPERVPEGILPHVDHLTPDHLEAEALTGVPAAEPAGARAAAEALRGRGVGTVHAKLASGGCVVADAEGTTTVQPPEGVTPTDKTGAGDAFAGALAWALHAGRGPVEATYLAVAAAACAVESYGSQEAYAGPDELAAMRRRVEAANRRP